MSTILYNKMATRIFDSYMIQLQTSFVYLLALYKILLIVDEEIRSIQKIDIDSIS